MKKSPVRSVRGGARQSEKKLAAAAPTHLPKKVPIPTTKVVIPTSKRLYVLDTNVFMHDPSCIYRFEEHDVFIPSVVFEELDNHKKGHDEINRNVREVSRTLENILSDRTVSITKGVQLLKASGGIASGRLFLQTENILAEADLDKPDNKILAVVAHLVAKNKSKCEVVLVSKDINMRIKGRIAGIVAEDYHNDMAIEDTDLLYQGATELPTDFWDKNKTIKSWKDGANTYYNLSGPSVKRLSLNEFAYTSTGKLFSARVVEKEGNIVTLQTVRDFTHKKNEIWGITARNSRQSYALDLLLDQNIDLITITGLAGSGKTLLTLACALFQTLESKIYTDIIFTRATVPIGEEIGFLPGTEEEKMTPWMGALDDNLDFLGCGNNSHNEKGDGSKTPLDWGKAATFDLVRNRLKVKSISFMRGRTFLNKFVIIDEAQNLTPKQMKALITRAGPGTKIVCLGNLSQIDTPYLTEGSSGLTHLVDRFKGWKNSGHITLFAGERSRLASHANEVL